MCLDLITINIEKASSQGRFVQRKLANGELLIVKRRQIDSDIDQKAAPIEQTTGRDRLSKHLWYNATTSATTEKKSLLPFLFIRSNLLVLLSLLVSMCL